MKSQEVEKMARRVLLIRHALSLANDKGSPAFGMSDAELHDDGKAAAEKLGLKLEEKLDIDRLTTRVAVSAFQRTDQTAELAGFVHRTPYEILSEIEHGLDLLVLKEMLAARPQQIPRKAQDVARKILKSPPAESIWFTHGLVIAGLSLETGITNYERCVPKFCEIRTLTLP